MSKKTMRKRDVWSMFVSLYPDLYERLRQDPIAVFVNWQSYTDSLCKDGYITQQQWQEWETPRPIYNAMHNK